VGSGLLAVPGGGAVAESGLGRAWLFVLVLATTIGTMGAGDAERGTRRRSRRIWLAGVGLFVLTLGLPVLVDAFNRNEAVLPLTIAAAFAALLTASLAALAGLGVAERYRARRDERARQVKRAPLLARSGRAPAAANVRPRRPGAAARSTGAAHPGSRRGRP
jgi:hypothetical protein